MATSPVLLNKKPFDAEKECRLQFTYSGSQIFSYKLTIRENSSNTEIESGDLTGEPVYEQEVAWMNTYIIIPANTLENGKSYNFQLIVYGENKDNDASLPSSPIVLKCLKTPVFKFANVPAPPASPMTVKNSYLDVEMLYEQENGELLNEYYVMLYYENKTSLVYTSSIQYADNLTVRISELMDMARYYIRAVGSTVNGMEIDTGFVEFSCNYLKPDLFMKFRADNIREEGSVRLSSNFIMVEGKSDPEVLNYIDGEKVDLLKGEKVWFDDGYQADNFVLNANIEDIPDFTTFMIINMAGAVVELSWNYGYFAESDDRRYYVELIAYHPIGEEQLRYIRISNLIPELTDDQQLFLWVRHVNGTFDVKIEAISDNTTQTQELTESVTEGVEA